MSFRLDSTVLRAAYSQGIFPMDNGEGVEWYRPSRRALLPIEGIRVSRSLARVIRRGEFRITFDQAFGEVMEGCMDRPEGSWITDEFISAYSRCHQEGWAHSCEVWAGEELAGGVYGLAVGSMFCGESMFSRKPNASKVALWALVERARELGFRAFDCQIINPHTQSLGAFEVSGRSYDRLLAICLQESTPWSASN